uniref:lactoylglutathione lyase n=1 Tax=Magnetococcus massalia (strain MO-1) TaxID=451514 RepID=A0A1S7LEI9_MAGMO|nr:lactoylglutathione lyase [Candidatus Magnetococcus massalia]
MQTTMLHTMIRVFDLDLSIGFYRDILGMAVIRQQDYPSGRFTLCYLGYAGEQGYQIELTHNWDQAEPYEVGSGYGHMAIGAADIYALCDLLRARGGQIVREPGPMKHGKTHIAFVRDPDGYAIELIQRA